MIKLSSISQREPFYYMERGKVSQKKDAVVVNWGEEEEVVPVAMMGALLLGNGVSITTKAMETASKHGCIIGICGGGGIPVFSTTTKYRSPANKIKQFTKTVKRTRDRVWLGRELLEHRNRICKDSSLGVSKIEGISKASTVEQLLGIEGAWVKSVYKDLRKDFPISDYPKYLNNLRLLNFFSYSIAHICIEHMGYEPNIGIIHGQTRGGGLVFDLADVWKPVISFVPAFVGTYHDHSSSKLKADALSTIIKMDVTGDMVLILKDLFK